MPAPIYLPEKKDPMGDMVNQMLFSMFQVKYQQSVRQQAAVEGMKLDKQMKDYELANQKLRIDYQLGKEKQRLAERTAAETTERERIKAAMEGMPEIEGKTKVYYPGKNQVGDVGADKETPDYRTYLLPGGGIESYDIKKVKPPTGARPIAHPEKQPPQPRGQLTEGDILKQFSNVSYDMGEGEKLVPAMLSKFRNKVLGGQGRLQAFNEVLNDYRTGGGAPASGDFSSLWSD